jgi:hypothetical protein
MINEIKINDLQNNEENNFDQIKNNKINLKNEYKSHQLSKLSKK